MRSKAAFASGSSVRTTPDLSLPSQVVRATPTGGTSADLLQPMIIYDSLYPTVVLDQRSLNDACSL